jgi:hypothetical protein
MDIIGTSAIAISLSAWSCRRSRKDRSRRWNQRFPRAFDEFLRFANQPLTIPTDAVSLFSFHGGGAAGPAYDQEAQASEASSAPSAVQHSRANEITATSPLSMKVKPEGQLRFWLSEGLCRSVNGFLGVGPTRACQEQNGKMMAATHPFQPRFQGPDKRCDCCNPERDHCGGNQSGATLRGNAT